MVYKTCLVHDAISKRNHKNQDLVAIKYTFKLKENHLISKFYEENTL